MTAFVDVRPGVYYDSVALMRVSRRVGDVAGVEAALVAMATPLNTDLLAGMGFEVPESTPADLVIAVRAADESAAERARAEVDAALAAVRAPHTGGTAEQAAPRTVAGAARAGTASVALIAVPGEHAFTEAMDAIDAGLHVMLFSDGVSVEREVALKDAAERSGVLVMGPDCGTAIVSGVGLGFANVTRPGPVGLVAASGTGAQQVVALLDAAGVGVSHVLGVGGRDLSATVAGRSTRRALAALGADPATEVVMLVSKPAPADVARSVSDIAEKLGKPVVTAVLGGGNDDLTAATEKVLATLGVPAPAWPSWLPDEQARPAPGALRGLYSGGTLCDEAMVIASDRLGAIRSNIPLSPELALAGDMRSDGHVFLDFGDDALTAGRAHPMIDGTLRLQRLAEDAADPSVSVILLDVVLGHGAHPDPAAELAPAIATAREQSGRPLAVVVALIGTSDDPQGLDRQAAALRDAGARVFLSNAAAARDAVALARGGAQ